MSKFMRLEAKAPATLGAVVEAVTRLSTYSEAEILDSVSAGKMKDLFPFKTARRRQMPADTVAEEDLIEASASPLNREQHSALIESSMPRSTRAAKRLRADRK
jgi:hypothetical protein